MSTSFWTDEQNQAIHAEGCSLLVSAAAGAGKTAVLVQRIIRKITADSNPVDVDRLLIVTFTKAAAAEMRERIGTALARELNRNPGSSHLRRQLALLNRASITTLHSFCLEIIRQYFHRLDLDPMFRVADDTEASLLKLETLEELFEECYLDEDPDFLALVDSYGGDRDDAALQDIVLRLYDFSASNPWPEDWVRQAAENYQAEGGLPLPWAQAIIQWVEFRLQGCRTMLERCLRLAGSPGGPLAYIDTLKEDIRLMDSLLAAVHISWDEFYAAASGIKFGTLKRCDKNVDDDLKDRVRKIRDTVKKTVTKLRDDYFSRHPGELAADLNLVAPMAKTLAGLVGEFRARYRKAKSDKGLLDFSDLEHYALQILLDGSAGSGKVLPSDAACELREYFAEVLVDEYQDINGVQETILQLVSRDESSIPNRFMVGDVKQSIYRFRLADPRLFMEKYRSYPRESGAPEQAIDLTRNFRSRLEVVNAVNFVFRQLMTPRVGELTYDDKAELVCGAQYPPCGDGLLTAAGPTELYILEKQADSEDDSGDEEAGDLDAVQREARLVAGRIRDMVTGSRERPGPEFCVYDKQTGGYRPVRYSDIVVLLRATRHTANTFIEELRLAGIPAYADLDTGYFEAVEVETMLALLKVIDNPRQDIPLAGVLRSPVVGLSAREMAAVRLRSVNGDYYDAVKESARHGETKTDLKLRIFLEQLERWRTMARRSSLSELIWRLYNDTGYYSYVGGMPGGTQRQANLRSLYERAIQFESTSFRGLFRFLRFIEKFRESGYDMGSARSAGETEDVVRVISIHKSKGLEFPVVVAAGLGKQFNTTDLKQKFLLHQELGLGLPVVDVNLRLSYPTIAQGAIAARLQMEMLAEEMRVLYVAMTRAREKLILVGSVRDVLNQARLWCENTSHPDWPLPDTDLAAARCFLDWICPAAARHRDGLPLRLAAGNEGEPSPVTAADPSHWQVHLCAPAQSPAGLQEAGDGQSGILDLVRELAPVPVEMRFFSDIAARLNWQYPFTAAVRKPAKATVTEIKTLFTQTPDEEIAADLLAEQDPNYTPSPARPGFLMKTGGLSPTEYGSAMHLVMQHIDHRGDVSYAGITARVREMVAAELLTEAQAEAVDIPAITGFYQSMLGQRLIAAPKVRKEVPFTMVLPASRIYSEIETEENILVQGVIDCLIDEGDGLVIIDYKTDRTGAEQVDDLIRRYSGQLDLYALAVEKVLKRPVKEKYLYLFALNREIRCR